MLPSVFLGNEKLNNSEPRTLKWLLIKMFYSHQSQNPTTETAVWIRLKENSMTLRPCDQEQREVLHVGN